MTARPGARFGPGGIRQGSRRIDKDGAWNIYTGILILAILYYGSASRVVLGYIVRATFHTWRVYDFLQVDSQNLVEQVVQVLFQPSAKYHPNSSKLLCHHGRRWCRVLLLSITMRPEGYPTINYADNVLIL